MRFNPNGMVAWLCATALSIGAAFASSEVESVRLQKVVAEELEQFVTSLARVFSSVHLQDPLAIQEVIGVPLTKKEVHIRDDFSVYEASKLPTAARDAQLSLRTNRFGGKFGDLIVGIDVRVSCLNEARLRELTQLKLAKRRLFAHNMDGSKVETFNSLFVRRPSDSQRVVLFSARVNSDGCVDLIQIRDMELSSEESK